MRSREGHESRCYTLRMTTWLLFIFSLLMAGLVSFAKAPVRALVYPLRTGEAQSLAARARIRVLDSYGSSLWGEISSQSDLEALEREAVVDLYPDWDIVETVHPFSVYEKQGIAAITARGLYVLHFNGPIRSEQLQQLISIPGLKPVQPFPNFAFVVWVGEVTGPLKLQLPNLDWVGPLEGEDKLSPELPKAHAQGIKEAYVLLANTEGVENDIEELKSICTVKGVAQTEAPPSGGFS